MFTFGQAINDIFSRERQFSEQRLQQARDLRMQAVNLKLRDRLNSALQKVYESQAEGNDIQNEVARATHDAMAAPVGDSGQSGYQRKANLSIEELQTAIKANNASADLTSTQSEQIEQVIDAYGSDPNADPANLKEAEIQANIDRIKQMGVGSGASGGQGSGGLTLNERMANSFFNALVDTSTNAKESLDDITNMSAALTNSDDPNQVTQGQSQLRSLTQEYNNAILGQNALASITGLPPTATALLVPEFDQQGKFIGYTNKPITQQDIQDYLQNNAQMRAYFGQGNPVINTGTNGGGNIPPTDTTGVKKMTYEQLLGRDK